MVINIQNTENVGGYKTLIPTLNPQCECGNCNCNSNQTKTDDEFQEETYVNEEGRTVYRRKCASSKCGKIFETTNSLKRVVVMNVLMTYILNKNDCVVSAKD